MMRNADISRAGALIIMQVPFAEQPAWRAAMTAAQSIDDVPAEWQERVLAAHKIILTARPPAARH